MEIRDMEESDSYKVVMAHAATSGVEDPFGLLKVENVVASINRFENADLDTADGAATAIASTLSDLITLYGRSRSVAARGTIMVNVIKMVEIMCQDSLLPVTITLAGEVLVDVTEEDIKKWLDQQAEMDVLLAAAQAMKGEE